MRLEDLDYQLPEELIAQHPPERREDARMLVVERATGRLHDCRVSDLPDWLNAGDRIVLNETRVRPARLMLRRSTGGRVELLLVRAEPGGRWRVLTRPAKHAAVGTTLALEDGSLEVAIEAAGERGERVISVRRGDLDSALRAHGEIPLPPYIHRKPDASDLVRYQTVFARVDGAIASPTAGLHFTNDLLARLESRGVGHSRVLLHVGPGTFRPVTTDDPRMHAMDEEWYEVTPGAASELLAARAAGGRIAVVGTTSVRALESACDAGGGVLTPGAGWTRKFIHAPYAFQACDVLMTNFHLPRTTLLLLVAAFAGDDLLRAAYAHAVRERYRFYSFGDSMLVV